VSVGHPHTAVYLEGDNLVVRLAVGSQDYFEGDNRLVRLVGDSRPTVAKGQPVGKVKST
jgi:hypothetical protein